MNEIIKNKKIIKISKKNIRTGKDGYLWGKPALESNILKPVEFKKYGIDRSKIR